jgi:dTDP-4-amino-4,6-dideoxygalactose transaminase
MLQRGEFLMKRSEKARAIIEALQDGDLTTNEMIRRFQHRFSEYVRQARAICLQNGIGEITCTCISSETYVYHLEPFNGKS